MNIHEKGIKARGHVRGTWVNSKTGETMPAFDHDNTLMYGFADAAARAVAGDNTRLPNRIGFIFSNGTKTYTWTGGRDLTWADLETELGNDADVQVVEFNAPSSTKSSDTDKFTGNVVTFHAHSDDSDGVINGIAPTGSSKFAHAVLLSGNSGSYNVIARVELADQPLTRPSGFELAFDWSITFDFS